MVNDPRDSGQGAPFSFLSGVFSGRHAVPYEPSCMNCYASENPKDQAPCRKCISHEMRGGQALISWHPKSPCEATPKKGGGNG